MTLGIRIVDADTKADRVRLLPQRFDLVQPLQHRLGTIGQHQTGSAAGRIAEHVDEILDDEGFATGEGKLFDAQGQRLVHERPDVRQRDPIKPVVAGF